jgi:hypothetical protein
MHALLTSSRDSHVLQEQNRALHSRLGIAEQAVIDKEIQIQQLQQQVEQLQQELTLTKKAALAAATAAATAATSIPAPAANVPPPPPPAAAAKEAPPSATGPAEITFSPNHIKNRVKKQPNTLTSSSLETEEASLSTAAKADALLMTLGTSTHNHLRNSQNPQHKQQNDPTRQGSGEIFFDFRDPHVGGATAAGGGSGSSGGGADFPLIGSTGAAGAAAERSRVQSDETGNHNNDDDDDSDHGPELVMDDEDEYQERSLVVRMQQQQQQDDDEGEDEPEEDDDLFNFQGHQDIAEVCVRRSKYANVLRKTSSITMGPEFFEEYQYDPLTPIRRPTPQPTSRVYKNYHHPHGGGNDDDDYVDNENGHATVNHQQYQRKNTPPPNPSTMSYDFLPSMVVTSVDERSLGVLEQQQQQQKQRPLQQQQKPQPGHEAAGRRPLMRTSTPDAPAASPSYRSKHHVVALVSDINGTAAPPPVRQERLQSWHELEHGGETVTETSSSRSSSNSMLHQSNTDLGSMPSLLPNTVGGDNYDDDDDNYEDDDCGAGPRRKQMGIQEGTGKGLPRELSLAGRSNASGSSTLPSSGSTTNTSFDKNNNNPSSSCCNNHGGETINGATNRNNKTNKLPRLSSMAGGSGNDGSPQTTYQVMDHPIVDACGDRGKYTGSLSSLHNIPEGYGEMRYHQPNNGGTGSGGRTYHGNWQNGHWHGQGRIVTVNGDVYEGAFQYDKKEGHGQLQFQDGRVFTGRFLNDQMREGVLHFGDGSKYEGLLKHGKRNGFGRYDFADGGSFYEGQWYDDQMDGRGQMEWADGGWYQGDWEEGLQHGRGREVLPNGVIRHAGWWNRGHPTNQEVETAGKRGEPSA